MKDITLKHLQALHEANDDKPSLKIGDSVVYMKNDFYSYNISLDQFKSTLSQWYTFKHEIGEEYSGNTCFYTITGMVIAPPRR